MLLFEKKPLLSKKEIKETRKLKWEHHHEVIDEMKAHDIEVTSFPSTSTPHLRIGTVDYWPATRRFYDFAFRSWGYGYEDLKKHIFNKRTMELRKAKRS